MRFIKTLMCFFFISLLASPANATSTDWIEIIRVQAALDGRFFIRVPNDNDANGCGSQESWYVLTNTDASSSAGKNIISAAYLAFASNRLVQITSGSCYGSFNKIDYLTIQ